MPFLYPSTVVCARKEGKVVYYSSLSQKAAVKISDLFEEKYPFIKVELTRAGANKILSKVVVEDETKKRIWDVVSSKGAHFVLSPLN